MLNNLASLDMKNKIIVIVSNIQLKGLGAQEGTLYMYILLTKRKGRTGRISTQGLDRKDWGLIFSQYGPEQAWLIRDLLHDFVL